MSEGFRVKIDDDLGLPVCYDCGKKYKDGDYAMIYLNVKKSKARCIDCHNALMIESVNSAGEQEYNPKG